MISGKIYLEQWLYTPNFHLTKLLIRIQTISDFPITISEECVRTSKWCLRQRRHKFDIIH